MTETPRWRKKGLILAMATAKATAHGIRRICSSGKNVQVDTGEKKKTMRVVSWTEGHRSPMAGGRLIEKAITSSKFCKRQEMRRI